MRRIFLMSSVLFVAPFMFGETGKASAQCVATTDCASLGYTEASCPNGGIKCPFGNTWSCKAENCDTSFKYACSGTGYAGGSGNSCGGKYSACQCATNYEWNSTSGKCESVAVLGVCTGKAQSCSVGQILNNDGSCSNSVVSGKTPIGVVVYISGGSDKCGYAMTARPIASSIIWSTEYVNTGAFQSSDSSSAIKDFDVSGNMTKIIQSGNSSTYPAAYAALNYAPSAAPTSKGKWALPTAGILNSLYTNLNAINNAISKVGGTYLTGDNEHIWSSSEFNDYSAWVFWTTNVADWDGVVNDNKGIYGVVRPVLAF